MKHCIHVYELVGSGLCPHCGKDTHETDWDIQLKLRQDYVKKVGILHQSISWWSM